MSVESKTYAWKRLTFPYHRGKTHSVEDPLKDIPYPNELKLGLVTGFVKKTFHTSVEYVKEDGFLTWIFGVPLEERHRVQVQEYLETTFGRAIAQDFTWRGAGVVTRLFEALAMGEYIQ